MMNTINHVVDTLDSVRLDKYLSETFSEWSRSYIQKLIKEGLVTVNTQKARSNLKVIAGDQISITIPDIEDVKILPENIPLDILYEDHHLLVINKPKGMVVHPAAGHYTGTLVNGIMYHCKGELSGINGELRPGIVHRIDKDTTGALVVCKDDQTHRNLAVQLKEHTITRKYRAIVLGNLKADGIIDAPIGRHPVDRKKMSINRRNGKRAVTNYYVLEQFGKYTYVECVLETGRTHQIRVHLSSIGHPLLGDILYGHGKSPYHLEGQTLHAMTLGFIHPSTGDYIEIEAPLPAYFSELLDKFRKN